MANSEPDATQGIPHDNRPADSKKSSAITRRSFIQYLGAVPGVAALPTFAGQNRPESGSKPQDGEPLGLSGILPFRQIHLDFHTSPGVPSVGEAFNASEFAEILKDAAVNSIAIFAKCNQGMSYYPTKVGVMHPGLKFDLLGEMIEALHKQGIRAVIYISTMYDQYMWEHHGDWRVLDAEGREDGLFQGTGPLEARLGRVCINTRYLDYLAAQAEEILKNYEGDGIFYDNYIYRYFGCYCASCMLERVKLGLDSTRVEDTHKHSRMVMKRGMERLFHLAHRLRPKGEIYFNGPISLSDDPDFIRSIIKYYTHNEIESLPGGSWGYPYYEVASRYFRNMGLQCLGMTGRFHRSWEDFGSIRNQAALDFECFRILAEANLCKIGDQLHPSGQLNRAVYKRIGTTYRSVAQKEPWCRGAIAVTEIGFLTTYTGHGMTESDVGVTGMLKELHYQFDMLDHHSDFEKYKILILPDSIGLKSNLLDKVKSYLAQGGKIILSDQSGLDETGKDFALSEVGLKYEGPWPHEVQYIEVLKPLSDGLPDMVEVAYEKGTAVKTLPGTTVLGRIWKSYFDRNYKHFFVEQTPYAHATEYVAVAARDNVIYIATPIFRSYAQYAYLFYKQLVGNCIRRLLPEPLIRSNAPSTAQITVTEQRSRRIVHVLNYVPERRAPHLDIVEEASPLADVEISLRSTHSPRLVQLVPQRQTLKSTFENGYVHVTMPKVNGHQMISFET
jgi:Hypothetical glycosyl hydrolase 6/Beta-galactosidase trimerisation domain